MCVNCYFKSGREKRATCCPDKPKYAKGFCQNCYMKKYSKDKRQQNKEARKATKQSNEAGQSLKIKKRVSGRDSIVSMVTAPTNVTPVGDTSPGVETLLQ